MDRPPSAPPAAAAAVARARADLLALSRMAVLMFEWHGPAVLETAAAGVLLADDADADGRAALEQACRHFAALGPVVLGCGGSSREGPGDGIEDAVEAAQVRKTTVLSGIVRTGPIDDLFQTPTRTGGVGGPLPATPTRHDCNGRGRGEDHSGGTGRGAAPHL